MAPGTIFDCSRVCFVSLYRIMFSKSKVKKVDFVTLSKFYGKYKEALQLELINSPAGLSRHICEPALNRPGLAIAGFYSYFANKRIQVFGSAELAYLQKLPEGMRENERFPEPIVTPTTKAEIGEHDADISKEEILAKGLATPEEYELLEKYTLALFKRGTEIAAERGLILVDTKYEFGKHGGKIYLMDEIHTPDSSRYFYSEGYEERFAKGEPQKQLSKEFVREWLMENDFQGKAGQKVPEMTPAIVDGISERYIELYEHITGEKFEKGDTDNLLSRIEKNVTEYLNK